MKLSLILATSLLMTACASNDAPGVAETDQAIPHVGPPEGFQTAENFDADDVRSMRESRDGWVAAFAAGDARALEFLFEKDAVIDLPDAVNGMPGEDLFADYTAELNFDESSEEFMTDGGDPRVMTRLPWVSYYGDYDLALRPKGGGQPIHSNGRFMTRFHRQPDGSLQVIRGPGVGDPAPPFALNTMSGGQEIRLAELWGEKPVVLVFGSYT